MTPTSAARAGGVFERFGRALAPEGDAECDGIVNPGAARLRDGRLVLYPRCVAAENVSRIGIAHATGGGDRDPFRRDGFALEPLSPYERRDAPGGYGCEDPRVTYVEALGRYVMTYVAFGPQGPAIALATSADGLAFERLGLVDFALPGTHGDKDGAVFPDVVRSPGGVASIAVLHRPTLHVSVRRGRAQVDAILALPPADREGVRIAYVPVDAARADPRALLRPRGDRALLAPDGPWGSVKLGAGPPPVRVAEGWLVLHHGVDPLPPGEGDAGPGARGIRYVAGIAILGGDRPHEVRYRAEAAVMVPQTPDELCGAVDDVVFPSGLDPRPDIGPRAFDVYYGMADRFVGRGRLTLDAAPLA